MTLCNDFDYSLGNYNEMSLKEQKLVLLDSVNKVIDRFERLKWCRTVNVESGICI